MGRNRVKDGGTKLKVQRRRGEIGPDGRWKTEQSRDGKNGPTYLQGNRKDMTMGGSN